MTTSGERERPSRSRSPSEERARPAGKETRRRTQTTDIGERLMSILEEPVPKPHMPDWELDECYHFALSLVPILHRLDYDSRQRANITILNTLHNLGKSTPPPPQNITGHSIHTSRPVGFQPHTPKCFPPPTHNGKIVEQGHFTTLTCSAVA